MAHVPQHASDGQTITSVICSSLGSIRIMWKTPTVVSFNCQLDSLESSKRRNCEVCRHVCLNYQYTVYGEWWVLLDFIKQLTRREPESELVSKPPASSVLHCSC